MEKENYSAHQEVSSKAQLGSSTESKVVTETTRTTSATVRLEHKSNFNDLPPMTISQRTQTPTIPLVSEGTMVDKDMSSTKIPQQSESTQTLHKEAETKYPFTATEHPAAEPVRKSALEFFDSNLKNLPALSEERYTRFEDAMKFSKTYVNKQQEIKEQFHHKLNDDLSFFNLKPEPPPEMSFMPKVQVAAAAPLQPEKIIEKVKKLEEIHSASERPLSGTVYPQNYHHKEEKFERKEFTEIKSTSSFPTQKPVLPQPSYLPPQNNINQLLPDSKIGRSPSPKPSAEGVNMEKLWTIKPKSPEVISQEQQQYNHQSFRHEQKSSFVAYSTQKILPPHEIDEPQIIAPSKEHFVPIQPYQSNEQQQEEELPKASIKETKSFFEQRIKEEEIKAAPFDLKAPSLVKKFAKPMVPLVPNNYDLGIEPGAPPEICYAPKPVLERKQSYVEKIEKSLEQNIENMPERVPHGGIRILPMRQTPQRTVSQSPQSIQPVATPLKTTIQQHQPVQSMQSIIDHETTVKSSQSYAGSPLNRQRPLENSSYAEQYKSESMEIKNETLNENLTGYRHVEPPKFLQFGKSSEPNLTSPKFQEPFMPTEQLKTSVKKENIKTQEVPIAIQKPEFKQTQPSKVYQIPIQQQQPKEIINAPFVKPSIEKFGEIITETRESHHSMYKNFVRSEQNLDTSESYFQRMASPKPVNQVPQNMKQEPVKKPEMQQSQVRKKLYPDVML